MSNICVKGINNIVSRAKKTLEEINEFTPFGVIYKDEEWVNLGTYDESLDSIKMNFF